MQDSRQHHYHHHHHQFAVSCIYKNYENFLLTLLLKCKMLPVAAADVQINRQIESEMEREATSVERERERAQYIVVKSNTQRVRETERERQACIFTPFVRNDAHESVCISPGVCICPGGYWCICVYGQSVKRQSRQLFHQLTWQMCVSNAFSKKYIPV